MRSGVLLGFTCCLVICAPLPCGTVAAGQLSPKEQAILQALEEDEARTAHQATPDSRSPVVADNRTADELSDQELEALASGRALPKRSLSAPSFRRPGRQPTAAPTPIAAPSPAGQSEPRQSSIEKAQSNYPAAAWLITQLGPNRIRMAGLEKLTPTELANLGSYVRDYAIATQQAGVERGAAAAVLYRAAGPSAPAGDAVESTIDGTFNGWDGDTIIKLTNGQIWQQASYHYDYHYAYRPDVTIYPSRGGYKAMVEDMDEAVEVRRLK